LAADYNQIELRIMAHLSQDEGLLSAFSRGVDIHKATASEVFGIDVEEVTDTQRRASKAINFGLIYGMSAFGLAKQLNVSRHVAQEYVERYFERYPGVKQYMDATRMSASDQGYVETIFGRRLYLPDINASNALRRQHAERTAINAPMQGSSADIIKKAMIDVQKWILEKKPQGIMIMQVHDELVCEVQNSELESFSMRIKHLMENTVSLDIPLLVDVGIGENWEQAH
jgi:DNA polymerase-1